MRERRTLIQARAAETLSFHETLEDVRGGKLLVVSSQEFAENFEAMFLATRCCVAQHAVGFDDFLEWHSTGAYRLERTGTEIRGAGLPDQA